MSVSTDSTIHSFVNLSLESAAPFTPPRLSFSPPPLSRSPSPMLLSITPPPPASRYEVVQEPLFTEVLSFDNDFLQSPEGDLVIKTLQWLIHAKGIPQKTIAEAIQWYNDAFKGGSCYGQAQTFLQLRARQQLFGDSSPTQIKIDTIFLQSVWSLTNSLRWTHENLKKRQNKVKKKMIDLQQLLCREKQALRQLRAQPQRQAHKPRIHALVCSKQQHVRDVALHEKHYLKFQKTRHAVAECMARLRAMRTHKYQAVGVVAKHACTLKRAQESIEIFTARVLQKIQALSQNPRHAGYIIGFHDGQEYGHSFALFPREALVYDVNIGGALQYTSPKALFEDLSTYFQNKNCLDVTIMPKALVG